MALPVDLVLPSHVFHVTWGPIPKMEQWNKVAKDILKTLHVSFSGNRSPAQLLPPKKWVGLQSPIFCLSLVFQPSNSPAPIWRLSTSHGKGKDQRWLRSDRNRRTCNSVKMDPLASTNADGKPLQTQSICLGNSIDSLFTCLTTRAGVAFIKWCEFSPCRVYCQHLECYGLKLGEETRRITTLSLVCGNHSSKRYVLQRLQAQRNS